MKTLISGGGIVTVTTLGGNSVISIRYRFNGIISFRPLESTETINVDMRLLNNGGSEGQWIRLFPTGTFRIPTDVWGSIRYKQCDVFNSVSIIYGSASARSTS